MNIEGMNQNEMHRLKVGNVTLLLQVEKPTQVDDYDPFAEDTGTPAGHIRVTQCDAEWNPFSDGEEDLFSFKKTETRSSFGADGTAVRVLFSQEYVSHTHVADCLRKIADLVEQSQAPLGLDEFKPGDGREG